MRMMHDDQVRPGCVDKILTELILPSEMLRGIFFPFMDQHHHSADLPILLHLQEPVAYKIV